MVLYVGALALWVYPYRQKEPGPINNKNGKKSIETGRNSRNIPRRRKHITVPEAS